jgi:hypothetical protein
MTQSRPIAPTPVEPAGTGGIQPVGERREGRRTRQERRRPPAPPPAENADEPEPEPIPRPAAGRIDLTV